MAIDMDNNDKQRMQMARVVFWAKKTAGDLAYAAPEVHEHILARNIALAMSEAFNEGQGKPLQQKMPTTVTATRSPVVGRARK